MFLADSGETAWIDRRAKPDVRPGRRTLGDALVYVYCLFFFLGGGVVVVVVVAVVAVVVVVITAKPS